MYSKNNCEFLASRLKMLMRWRVWDSGTHLRCRNGFLPERVIQERTACVVLAAQRLRRQDAEEGMVLYPAHADTLRICGLQAQISRWNSSFYRLFGTSRVLFNVVVWFWIQILNRKGQDLLRNGENAEKTFSLEFKSKFNASSWTCLRISRHSKSNRRDIMSLHFHGYLISL